MAVATYACALLDALARDEMLGRRSRRLTEVGQATWQRFRGRLGSADLLRLLAEDAAVSHPTPFATLPLLETGDDVVDVWLKTRVSAPPLSSAAYVEAQAKRLGIPTRLGRTELHQVKPHQKVLELPGTGGQLAHHLVTTQSDLSLQVNCTIACDGWNELTLAGIVALDVGTPNSNFIVAASAEDLANDKHPLRLQRFDFVVGLSPTKGGKLVIDDQLAVWFHGAKIVLV